MCTASCQRRSRFVDVAGAQVGGELVVGRLPVADELATQRLEGGAIGVVEDGDGVVPLEHLHVEVARRARDVADELEARLGPCQHVGGEDVATVAQDRARAAHGHAQVVEELAVDVVDRALAVDLDGVVEVGEDEPEALDGRQLGIERDARLDRRPRAIDAGDGEGRVDARRPASVPATCAPTTSRARSPGLV